MSDFRVKVTLPNPFELPMDSMRKAMSEIMLDIERRAKERVGSETGTLKQSIVGKLDETVECGGVITADAVTLDKNGQDVYYGVFVEYGTGPYASSYGTGSQASPDYKGGIHPQLFMTMSILESRQMMKRKMEKALKEHG